MRMKRYFFIAVAALTLVLLAACQMPASTPPPGQDTGLTPEDGGFPRPEDVTNPFEGLEIAATQTAMAEAGGGEPGGAETGGGQQVEATPTQATAPQPQETQPPAQVEEPQPEVDVPTPTPGVPQTYTLQPGEFPYCIARRYNVNPAELLSLNGLGRLSQVQAGFTLKMPQTGNPWPGDRQLIDHPDTYTVQAGDTLYKIACAYGDVDPVYLAQYNGLKEPYRLEAGQKLEIP